RPRPRSNGAEPPLISRFESWVPRSQRFFLSFTFTDCELGSPPVGVYVTATFSFTLPVAFSFRFLFPFALITSFAWPAPTSLLTPARAEAALAPFPDRVSWPGFGRVRLSVAVPFLLLSCALPRVKVLLG